MNRRRAAASDDHCGASTLIATYRFKAASNPLKTTPIPPLAEPVDHLVVAQPAEVIRVRGRVEPIERQLASSGHATSRSGAAIVSIASRSAKKSLSSSKNSG